MALTLCSLALAACAAQSGGTTSAPTPEATTPSATPSPTAVPTPHDLTAEDFTKQAFDRSTVIDNRWFPMRPGARYVYEGSASEGSDRVARKIIFIVTDLTKVVEGVRSVVIWERDFNDGELIESELALFAQDNEGNVWHLGQYPEEYDNGKLDKAPTWIHGLAGARAGITMKKTPKLGAPDYSQGFAPPPINWIDRARVHKTGQRTCVPAGCYNNVLITEEFEQGTPNASQLKYYAPGVGTVRVAWSGSAEQEREVLELVAAGQLTPKELAQARAEALALEKHAYQISKDVYALTAPAA